MILVAHCVHLGLCGRRRLTSETTEGLMMSSSQQELNYDGARTSVAADEEEEGGL